MSNGIVEASVRSILNMMPNFYINHCSFLPVSEQNCLPLLNDKGRLQTYCVCWKTT